MKIIIYIRIFNFYNPIKNIIDDLSLTILFHDRESTKIQVKFNNNNLLILKNISISRFN